MAEKIKIKKEDKAKNVYDLGHHFANSVFPKETRGKYSYEGNSFFIGSSEFARIIDKKKKVVLIRPFGGSGGWGGGYSDYSLSRAFSEEWTVLKPKYNFIYYPKELKDFTKEDLESLVIYNLETNVTEIFKIYVRERYRIEDPDVFQEFYKDKTLIQSTIHKIDKLCKQFKVSKSKVLKHIYNTKQYVCVSYRGWVKNSNTTVCRIIDKPILFYLNPTEWHSEEELKILDFKSWKNKYYNIAVHPKITWFRHGKTYKEIYYNEELKADFEKNVEAANKRYKQEIEAAKQREQEKELVKQLEKLESWLKGNVNSNLWNVPIHCRIKDGRIETTKNAVIPLEAGKRLFKFFNTIRQGSIDRVVEAKDYSDKVGFYEFRKIEYYNNHWWLCVGCHNIRDTEIDKFINYNKLDW